mmetsp:Transcript_52019/g.156118  ORF Transcript_52019/g.156118 Transcript_52019/m.156118 type:complete len:709 (-) Transcript_52019:125-2251(-)
MANDSDSSDESLGDFSVNDDPFSFEQRKFVGTKKASCKTSYSISGDDSDSNSSSWSSSPSTRMGRKGAKKVAPKGRPRKRASGMKKRHRSSFDIDYSSSDSSSSDEDKENNTKSSTRRSVVKGNAKGSRTVPACIDLSSDSSDESVIPPPSRANSSSTTRRVTRTAARAAAAAAAASKSESPSKRKKSDLLDANKDTVNALQEARQAMEALKEAQQYRAEDTSFELEDNVLVCIDDESGTDSSFQVFSPEMASGLRQKASPSEAPTGMPIRLNVRIITSNGNSSGYDGEKVMCKIRTDEKLQAILSQLSSVIGSCHAKFSFDGQNLSLEKTPIFYDLEDEDLVDAVIQTTKVPGKIGSCAGSQSSSLRNIPTRTKINESRVVVRTRIKGGDPRRIYDFSIRKTDPLQKLIDAYGKENRESGSFQTTESVNLEYNGRPLKPSTTPANEGIVDNCMLEINDEVERQLQRRCISRVGASSPQPGRILVKCRINGNDKNMQSFGILPSDAFRVLIDDFCSQNALTSTDCKFKFDGELLRTNQTPLQLDVEGDEIIEVLVSESVLATAQSSSLAGNSRLPSSKSEPTLSRQSTRSAPSSRLNSAYTRSDNCSSVGSSPPRSLLSDSSKIVVSIQIMRNNDSKKSKKFKLYSNDTLDKLREGYKKYYKKRGCRSVEFYLHGAKLNKKSTVESLGLREMDVIVAMENGKKLNISR